MGGSVDPRTSLDTEWRKIFTPPTPEIEPGPSSPLPSALPLEPPRQLYNSVGCTLKIPIMLNFEKKTVELLKSMFLRILIKVSYIRTTAHAVYERLNSSLVPTGVPSSSLGVAWGTIVVDNFGILGFFLAFFRFPSLIPPILSKCFGLRHHSYILTYLLHCVTTLEESKPA